MIPYQEGLDLAKKYPFVRFFFYRKTPCDNYGYIPILRPDILEQHFKTSIENTKDAIMNAMSDSSSTLYFLIVLLIIAAFVCYIVYYIIVDTVIIQQRILIPGTEMPIICSQHSKYPFTQELDSGNGNKRTYCFWIYIFDIKAADGQYRHVASIYPNKSDTVFHSVKDSTIYIRLDSKKNSLQVRFPTVDDDKTTFEADSGKMPINEFLVNTKGTENKNLVTGVEIEYIPIQRWVHVGIVINDIGGGTFNIRGITNLAVSATSDVDTRANVAGYKAFTVRLRYCSCWGHINFGRNIITVFFFNNFNLIYLLTGGGPRNTLDGEIAGATDILISYTYQIAFGRNILDFGLASAISVLIFFLVASISFYGLRKSKVMETFN